MKGTDGMWDDAPIPEDAAIDAAFPTRSGRHDLYAEAMRMVGAKRSKGELVKLVNWLLVRGAAAEALVAALPALVAVLHDGKPRERWCKACVARDEIDALLAAYRDAPALRVLLATGGGAGEPDTDEDPDCARCGHAASLHRPGGCGATCDDDERCSCRANTGET